MDEHMKEQELLEQQKRVRKYLFLWMFSTVLLNSEGFVISHKQFQLYDCELFVMHYCSNFWGQYDYLK